MLTAAIFGGFLGAVSSPFGRGFAFGFAIAAILFYQGE